MSITKDFPEKNTRYKAAASLITLLLVLSACENRLHIDWDLTIPNDYSGFLVIRYECPNGQPLTIRDSKIYLEFNDDGTACIADKQLATSGKVSVKFKNGKPVRFAPQEGRGYGLLWIQGRWAEREGVEYGPFEVLWAGNVEKMMQDYNLEGLDEFLEARFGVPQIKVVVTLTPP